MNLLMTLVYNYMSCNSVHEQFANLHELLMKVYKLLMTVHELVYCKVLHCFYIFQVKASTSLRLTFLSFLRSIPCLLLQVAVSVSATLLSTHVPPFVRRDIPAHNEATRHPNRRHRPNCFQMP